MVDVAVARQALVMLNPTVPVWAVPEDVVAVVGRREWYFSASLVDRFSWDIFEGSALVQSLVSRMQLSLLTFGEG